MADLSITMHGDASGAAGAMKDVAHEASALHEVLEGSLKGALGSTVATFSSLETVAEKAAEVVKDFFKESIEEYSKAEAAQRQLRFVAGELTEAFERQAKVISENLAIKDEDVEHMQTLLLRYGAAPETIGNAVVAIQNFAAATGQDANSALMMMIRGVEAGHGSLGRMGVQFQATGDFAADLASAVQALNEKFGGAAETEAEGLTGRMRAAHIAVEDLEKSVGGFFATIESKLHVLQAFSNYVKVITAGGGSGLATLAGINAMAGGGTSGGEEVPRVGGGGKGAGVGLTLGELSLSASPEAAKKAEEALEKQLKAENEYLDKKWLLLNQDIDAEQKHDDEILKGKEKLYDEEAKGQAEFIKRADDSEKEATKQLLKEMKEEHDDIGKLNDVLVSRLTSQKTMYENAGMQLGQAFATALEQAMEGGTQSAEDIALNLTESILTIAGGVLGSIAGEGDPYAAQAGSMLGHLAGAGIKAGVHANDKKRHDGGWTGERFHVGGWPMASDEQSIITQSGERVLSRREVATMGGASAVDRAARGGGSQLHVHVSAIDTRSTREFFENDGGRGFYNALRTGRGSLVPLFGSQS